MQPAPFSLGTYRLSAIAPVSLHVSPAAAAACCHLVAAAPGHQHAQLTHIRCHSSSTQQQLQVPADDTLVQHQPWRALTTGVVGLLEGEFPRLPAPLLLALCKACASVNATLSNRQVFQLCCGWQQQLHHTTAQQCITLLTSLTEILPSIDITAHAASAGTSPEHESAADATLELFQEQLQQQRQLQGLTLDWLQDVYWHVASLSHNLSMTELVTFLEAAEKLGGLTATAVAQLLHPGSDLTPSSETNNHLVQAHVLQQAAVQATPTQAARVLTILYNMGMTLPAATLSALVEAVHAGADSLPPASLLEAYQAAILMSHDMSVTWLQQAFNQAERQLSDQGPEQLVSILSSVSLCCAHMPTILLQYQWQNQVGLPSNGSTNQRAVLAYQAARSLVCATCKQLVPHLSQLQMQQLVTLAVALQQVRFTVMFPDAVTRVTVGTGAGVHGQSMVNSFPVTIIEPSAAASPTVLEPPTEVLPSVPVVLEPAQDPSGDASQASTGVTAGNVTVQLPAGLAAMVVTDSSSSSSSSTGAHSTANSSSTTDNLQGAFLHSLHDAYLTRIGEFTSADELADMIRPLAAIRSLPSYDQLARLCQQLEAYGQTSGSTLQVQQEQESGHTASVQEMTPHAICMALFLLSMLSHPVSATTLQAAQAQLIPVMSELAPGDLTSAVWAFACLGGATEPRTMQHDVLTGMQASSMEAATSLLEAATSRALESASQAAKASAAAAAAAAKVEAAGGASSSSSGTAGSSGSTTDSGSSNASVTRVGSIKAHTLADIAAGNTANAGARARQAAVAAAAAASQSAVRQVGDNSDMEDEQPAWLQPAVEAALQQLDQLAPYQIAFLVASLERSRSRISPEDIDQMLDAFQQQLHIASAGDVVLLLASVARLGHVTSYAWMDAVVENWAAPRLQECSPKMLATVAWSLAKLHHRPSTTFITQLLDAAEPQLSAFTVDNMATLVWAVSELDSDAPVTLFLDALCEEAGPRLSEFNPRDLVALLGALARLKYQPTAPWMVEWLQAISPNMAYLEPQAFPQIINALSAMDARITSSQWWARLMAVSSTQLQLMDAETLLSLAAGLAGILDTDPPHNWSLAFSQAIEKICGQAVSGPTWGQQANSTAAGGSNRSESEGYLTTAALSLSNLGTHMDGIWTPPASGSSTLTAVQHELLLALQLKLAVPPGPLQMAHMEMQLAGLAALRALGPDRLIRLVGSLAAVAAAWGGSARMPRAAWLGGPLCEALRAALPDMALIEQSQLAKALGELVTALDDRHNGPTRPKTPLAGRGRSPQPPGWEATGGWEGMDGAIIPSWSDTEETEAIGPMAGTPPSPTQTPSAPTQETSLSTPVQASDNAAGSRKAAQVSVSSAEGIPSAPAQASDSNTGSTTSQPTQAPAQEPAQASDADKVAPVPAVGNITGSTRPPQSTDNVTDSTTPILAAGSDGGAGSTTSAQARDSGGGSTIPALVSNSITGSTIPAEANDSIAGSTTSVSTAENSDSRKAREDAAHASISSTVAASQNISQGMQGGAATANSSGVDEQVEPSSSTEVYDTKTSRNSGTGSTGSTVVASSADAGASVNAGQSREGARQSQDSISIASNANSGTGGSGGDVKSSEARELWSVGFVATETEKAPASLRNLLAYLREFYLYN